MATKTKKPRQETRRYSADEKKAIMDKVSELSKGGLTTTAALKQVADEKGMTFGSMNQMYYTYRRAMGIGKPKKRGRAVGKRGPKPKTTVQKSPNLAKLSEAVAAIENRMAELEKARDAAVARAEKAEAKLARITKMVN